MMFGAAMSANTLDDLDLVNQMALKMDCPPLFKLSEWADVRLSRGENGSFLFINNYQDDPIETTIDIEKGSLLGGYPVQIPARRGLILPIDWKLNQEVMIHYVTSEIVEMTDEGSQITLKTEQAEFFAEMSLSGCHCDNAIPMHAAGRTERVKLHGQDGLIILKRTEAYETGTGKRKS